MSAIHVINKTLSVDVYCIDLTRTKGEDQSSKDLFSAVEQIKNGFVIDTMYGKYNESFFEPPVVIIFSNNPLYDSQNRNLRIPILLILFQKMMKKEYIRKISELLENITKVNSRSD